MIRIVAKYTVKAETVDQFKSIVVDLATETRKETGCVSYQLYQDIKDNNILAFIEEWQDREALSNHMNSKHFKDAAPKLGQLKEKDVEVNIYSLMI
jgi:quinol monooxygenase YgiN